ncbi:MAG TPA: glycosyltransferase family A protein [Rhizomicrobium sp.]|jgi:glycosyltransferase involved in cell wall biosynthesis|nr:glycosyltransferase family A protein [Rhizomicrobium sp.]
MATVDVMMPVRNGLPFLPEAVDSIRNQTFSDWRLLVLDHGSSDGSLEFARHCAESDQRISVSSHPEAAGIAELRNIGLAKCDCHILMLQDADDVSFPNRMETVISAFQHSPELLVLGGEAEVINPEGRRIGYLAAPREVAAVAAASFFYFPIVHPAAAANFADLMHLDAAYGKDIMYAVPPSESVRVGTLAEDYILFGQLALLGPCANLPLPLIRYRRHPESTGVRSPRDQIGQALKISRFLAKSFCLKNGLEPFDPGPFCNHADHVFDFGARDYSEQFQVMAAALRRGLGPCQALERELAFREILATRERGAMTMRFLRFLLAYGASGMERRTVRNWLLKDLRQGKYVYRPREAAA